MPPTVPPVVVVNIDPMLPKQAYDVDVQRGLQDVEWVAPAGTQIVVRIVGPKKFALGPSGGSWKFDKAFHTHFPASGAGHTDVDYEIEVYYPAGKLLIDPIVKIQP
ncbi:MAG: hypothetical protein WC538_02175 [Thermoanaerobaculia bacterium]|jgi:hypothetical protein